ncbi:hypothetical protein [Mesoplasma coleopterae]|uniref:Uncharacterized protein n=1 Tax=Mesoplasma coleopterae TaxID=324078 RepID=A0A2K8P5J0_9MOLU|nr:hypothetical protein [Mesoplasma coleopterae]ATZ21003.1 hypothetical protein MCOLE_v1c04910 [Mesoplasma coleopterae]
MKIDLHCHTIATKKGESKKRNLGEQDFSIFFSNAKKNNVRVIGITNHNYFDLKHFRKMEMYKPEEILFLPGVELDIKIPKENPIEINLNDNNKEKNNKLFDIFNFNIIADSNKTKEFSDMIVEILNGHDAESFLGLTINDLEWFLDKYDISVIGLLPTSSKQNNNKKIMTNENLENLKNIFSKKGRYYKFELGNSSFKNNEKTQEIFRINKLSYTVGSDSHDSSNIEYKNVESYDINMEFCNIMEYINFCKKVVKNLEPMKSFELDLNLKTDEGVFIDNINLNFVDGINIISGKYGTGKSILLKAALNAYNDLNNTNISMFYGGKPETNFNEIKESHVKNAINQFNLEEVKFHEISKYVEDETLNKKLFEGNEILSKIIEIKEYYENEGSQNFNGWNNLTFNEEIEAEIEKNEKNFNEEINKINLKISNLNDWKNNSEKYFKKVLESPEFLKFKYIKDFNKSLNEIFNYINDALLFEITSKQTIRKRSLFLSEIRKAAQSAIKKNKGEKTNPSAINLRKYYSEKERIRNELRIILDLPSTFEYKEKLGRLSRSESVYINIEFLKNDLYDTKGYKAIPNSNFSDKRNSLSINEYLTKIYNEIYSSSFSNLFYKHMNDSLKELLKLKPTIEKKELYVFKTYFKINNNILTGQLSSGQRKLLTISSYLEEEREAYFLDEPEVFLDSKTTNEIILDKIIELDIRNKPIFIATHNANLAINTQPRNIIVRKYEPDQNIYKTYFGNKQNGYLRDLDNTEVKIKAAPELLDMMEGGEKEFYSREEYYNEQS